MAILLCLVFCGYCNNSLPSYPDPYMGDIFIDFSKVNLANSIYSGFKFDANPPTGIIPKDNAEQSIWLGTIANANFNSLSNGKLSKTTFTLDFSWPTNQNTTNFIDIVRDAQADFNGNNSVTADLMSYTVSLFYTSSSGTFIRRRSIIASVDKICNTTNTGISAAGRYQAVIIFEAFDSTAERMKTTVNHNASNTTTIDTTTLIPAGVNTCTGAGTTLGKTVGQFLNLTSIKDNNIWLIAKNNQTSDDTFAPILHSIKVTVERVTP